MILVHLLKNYWMVSEEADWIVPLSTEMRKSINPNKKAGGRMPAQARVRSPNVLAVASEGAPNNSFG
jgi:hypothetical protein